MVRSCKKMRSGRKKQKNLERRSSNRKQGASGGIKNTKVGALLCLAFRFAVRERGRLRNADLSHVFFFHNVCLFERNGISLMHLFFLTNSAFDGSHDKDHK